MRRGEFYRVYKASPHDPKHYRVFVIVSDIPVELILINRVEYWIPACAGMTIFEPRPSEIRNSGGGAWPFQRNA